MFLSHKCLQHCMSSNLKAEYNAGFHATPTLEPGHFGAREAKTGHTALGSGPCKLG